jgi:hypothetical protein
MAYLDLNGKVATAQAFTTGVLSASSVDLGAVPASPSRDVGTGEELVLLVQVTVLAVGATTLSVVQSDNADLSASDTLITRPMTAAQLPANTLAQVPIPEGSVSKRYLGMLYTGTSMTCNAWILPDKMVPQYRHYPKGYVIS